jgi:hypothetical protein
MSNSPLKRIGTLPSIAGRNARVACVIACLLATSAGAGSVAQEITADIVMQEIKMDTGLHTIQPGHVFNVMFTETGAPRATSRVKIVVRDQADRVVARHEGTLQRANHVFLELPIAKGTGRALLRVTAVITGAAGQGSAPIGVVEDLNPDALTTEPIVYCAPPAGRTGAQTLCPGWQVTDVTTITTGS